MHACHKALMGYISTMTQEDFLKEEAGFGRVSEVSLRKGLQTKQEGFQLVSEGSHHPLGASPWGQAD